MIEGCQRSWKFWQWSLSLSVGEIAWLVEQSGRRDVSGGEGVILGPVDCCGGSKYPEYRSRCLDGKKWVCDLMAKGANQMLNDCTENEGKMAWLFIEVLSRADTIDLSKVSSCTLSRI